MLVSPTHLMLDALSYDVMMDVGQPNSPSLDALSYEVIIDVGQSDSPYAG